LAGEVVRSQLDADLRHYFHANCDLSALWYCWDHPLAFIWVAIGLAAVEKNCDRSINLISISGRLKRVAAKQTGATLFSLAIPQDQEGKKHAWSQICSFVWLHFQESPAILK
jgi:hypothetical protein